MKTKNIVALGLSICTLLSSTLIVSAQTVGKVSVNSDVITPQFVYTYDTITNLAITSNTARVSCSLEGYSTTTKVVIYAYLQQYKNGSWVTISNWSETFNDSCGDLYETYTVSSGYSYRVQASYYAYKGTANENIVDYSGTAKS